MAARLSQFQQGKIDLQADTEHKQIGQKETGPDELLPDTVANRPWMLYVCSRCGRGMPRMP